MKPATVDVSEIKCLEHKIPTKVRVTLRLEVSLEYYDCGNRKKMTLWHFPNLTGTGYGSGIVAQLINQDVGWWEGEE